MITCSTMYLLGNVSSEMLWACPVPKSGGDCALGLESGWVDLLPRVNRDSKIRLCVCVCMCVCACACVCAYVYAAYMCEHVCVYTRRSSPCLCNGMMARSGQTVPLLHYAYIHVYAILLDAYKQCSITKKLCVYTSTFLSQPSFRHAHKRKLSYVIHARILSRA